MNTGHSGSMTTIHTNSPKDMITRLETMLLLSGNNLDPSTARRIIATSINLLIQLEKTSSGKRILSKISEIRYSGGNKGGKIDLELRDIIVLKKDKDRGSGDLPENIVDKKIKNRWIFNNNLPVFLKERR